MPYAPDKATVVVNRILYRLKPVEDLVSVVRDNLRTGYKGPAKLERNILSNAGAGHPQFGQIMEAMRWVCFG